MENIAVTLSELNMVSILVRLMLAAFMGGIIGVERGRKRRPAGFRTYMLVCLGAALVMMTNEFIIIKYGGSDPARLGAQVISGIGFLGAGTIIVTRHNQVIGLTTAAGLWASACMGLAIGIGFYGGALLSFFAILFIMLLLHRFDHFVAAHSKVMELYVEFLSPGDLGALLHDLREREIRISDLEIVKSRDPEQKVMAAIMNLKLTKAKEHDGALKLLQALPGIEHVEEL